MTTYECSERACVRACVAVRGQIPHGRAFIYLHTQSLVNMLIFRLAATFGERPVAMKELIATLFDPEDRRALADLEVTPPPLFLSIYLYI